LTEPFRLVMIEAMACGMPVLAFRSGSVPEIVEDGLTERIVSSSDEAIQAIPELLALDRKAIRARFEERFSSQRMASDYVKIYHTILRKRVAPQIHVPARAAHPADAGRTHCCLAGRSTLKPSRGQAVEVSRKARCRWRLRRPGCRSPRKQWSATRQGRTASSPRTQTDPTK
jgi:hypothetical protein